ncbi:LOW QUALITY PROTEIN: hypothetical protein ACHAW6_007001 [Cyclotella cf. meneghiniana]
MLLDLAANISLLTPMRHFYKMQPLYQLKQSCNHPGILSQHQATQLSCYQNFPSQQNRHSAYQVAPTIYYLWLSLLMQAVKCIFTTQDVRLWQVPLKNDEGNIVPPSIVEFTETTPQACSIYECENINQLINFYYATMGYPVVSTWCKAINKGYFQGWKGLTFKRVRNLVKPSEHNLMGHLDQRQQGIRSTKSATSVTTAPDPMEEPHNKCP